MVHTTDRSLDRDERALRAEFLGHDPDPESPLARALDHALGTQEGDSKRPRSIDVALILRHLGVDESTQIATLLSDRRLREVLQPEVVRSGYGEDVAKLVASVHWLNTFKDCEHEQVHTPEQAERLRRMLLAMIKDVRALLIKLAYRVQRLRLLAREDYEIRRCVARETLDIYAPLANRLGVAQLKWELEDLAFRYLDPQTYKEVARSLDESRVAREAYLKDFMAQLHRALADAGIQAQLSGRPKHIYSIWRKMQNKQLELNQLYDLRAVRVVVDNVPDCYAALGVVHTLWSHIAREFDDYIANPKDNGYRSLHTAVVAAQAKVVEVQIRTREMHEFAERGVAAHWAYKEGSRQDALMQRCIDSLRRMLEAGKGDGALWEDFRNDVFEDRVFVLTPSGEIQDLPKGSTPLDFAYSIHTEIGHRCRGAKVDGRIVPLTYRLSSGEQVEILTTREGRPSRDWLNPHLGYLHSSRSRAKVRQWFKHQDRERNLRDGRAIVERELQRLGLKGEALGEAIERFNLHGEEDLMVEVGRGNISLAQLAGTLHVPELPGRVDSLEVRRESRGNEAPAGVTVSGVGNLLTDFARCCKPMPGDPIVGYITQGRGITIHRQDCGNVLRLDSEGRRRLVEVAWGNGPRVFPVDVSIEAYDRQGLLRDITTILGNERVNLLRADTQTNSRDQSVKMALTLELADTRQLARVLDLFLQVPNVMEARRRGA